MIDRRGFAGLALLAGRWGSVGADVGSTATTAVGERLRRIERRTGGRLGVCIVDTAGGTLISQRADERFPMCSTFKLMACALALKRVDQGTESLARVLPYGRLDLVPNSPVTTAQVGRGGMTLAALCEATLTTSDNTAANLILASYGGPAGFTRFMRSIGDPVTRLDRFEPALNSARADDPRDTTSPAAMLQSVRQVLLGDVLSTASREQMQHWMTGNTTGATRLRAGLPEGWRVGDKTGKGAHGTTNDIAIVWPPGRAPWLVTAYLTRGVGSWELLDGAIADVGRLLADVAGAPPR